MSDIFLSYASEDLDRIKPLASALSAEGWTVFYDRTIPPGKTWRMVIGKEIDQCRCMVVCWSTRAVNSHWVLDEADIGLKRQILIPLFLDQITPPLGFGGIQAANLIKWQGKTDSSGYLALCNAITELIGTGSSAVPISDYPPHQQHVAKTKIRWPKPLTAKVGIITVVLAIPALLFWWYGEEVLVSQQIEFDPSQAVSDGNNAAKENVTKTDITSRLNSVDSKGSDQPLITEPEMVRIPAGGFQIGSDNGGVDEMPVHPGSLESFAIGRYEVSFDEYDQFAEAVGKIKPDDNGWGRGKRPVINISWDDASAYAAWLSEKTGNRYRLPTESEWEYAARAGTATKYYWGQEDSKNFAWFTENLEGETHPVGKKQPNAFGLYDMSGNVWEWVQDCYADNYDRAPKDGTAWDPKDCPLRVLRGGSWYSVADDLRSANRSRNYPDSRDFTIGFRLAQELP